MSKSVGTDAGFFEALEGRLLLSGDMFISVSHGKLNISGDSADNDVVISQGATADEFIISSGANATTFSTSSVTNSPGPITVTGVTRDINVQGRNGADVITFQANAPRSLNLNGGSGSNTIVVTGTAVRDVNVHNEEGDDNVGVSVSARNVSIGNEQGDNVTLVDQAILTGSLTIFGRHRSTDTVTVNDSDIAKCLGVFNGSGAGSIDIIGMTGSATPIPVTVGGNLSLSANGTITVDQVSCKNLFVGVNGMVTITNATTTGSVDIDTGNAADTVGISGMTVGRNLSINTRNGDDLVLIDSMTVNGKTSIDTGKGNDIVNVEAEAVSTGPTSEFFGKVTVNTRQDNDSVTIGNKARTDTANHFFSNVTVNTDGGIDTLDVLNNGNVFDVPIVVKGNPTVT